MRIVAGKHRGRALEAPPGAAIRPTSDRARETLFNILAHGALERAGVPTFGEAIVLDAFCGTGALAFEALSRGARRAMLMDRARSALAAARANARALGEEARVILIEADATKPPIAGARPPASLAFIEPPYGSGLALPALVALAAAGWIAPRALIAVETQSSETIEAPEGFAMIDRRRIGKAAIALLARG
jgi:16S rRNA (guanine966-N2)-methyltransferase